MAPCLTTPGKPTETRSKSPISLRNSSSPARTASGVGTSGVRTRFRSLTGLPAGVQQHGLQPRAANVDGHGDGEGRREAAERELGGGDSFGCHQDEL